jgi:hypothetical protein
MLNEAHMGEHRRGMALRVLIGRMRHDGCGGLPAKTQHSCHQMQSSGHGV